MSAFIVSTDTIDLIVSALARIQGAELSSPLGLQTIGADLWAENHRSVNFRYSESTVITPYTFRPVDLDTIPHWRQVALKSLKCWRYQSCETPTFAETTAAKVAESLIGLLRVSGEDDAYESAPWGWERGWVPPAPPQPKPEKVYTTAAEDAATIRAALKAKGWNSRDVSVRAHVYSMGSSLYVTIKRAQIPIADVEAIANRAESIDRDQWGEILSGGNRFVHVAYDSAVLDVMTAEWLGAVDAAYLELSAASANVLIPIPGTKDLMLGRDSNGHGFALWGEHSHLQNAYDLQSIARAVGVRMVAETRDAGIARLCHSDQVTP